MTVELTWNVVVGLVVLVAIGVAVHALGRTGLAGSALVACVRAVVQLGVAAAVIAAAVSHLGWSLLVVAAMFAMAVVTTVQRTHADRRSVPYAALAVAAGLAPVVAVLLVSRPVPATGLAIIPVAGILVGNTMSAHTLVGRRCFAALEEEHQQYEAFLALGFLPHQAIAEIVDRCVPEGLVTGLDQIRTTGIVTLPGAFIGAMLGGGSPVQAATAQVMVLFGIMTTQVIVATVESRLVARRLLLTADLRRSLVD